MKDAKNIRNHFLGLANLPAADFLNLLTNALALQEISGRDLKKVPALRGKTIVNLFFEASTRTRTSFEIAAQRLSADIVNINLASSSVSKGETLRDTVRTLEAMAVDAIVVRHSSSGVPTQLSNWLTNTSIINAGDGTNEHPSQALLDSLTLANHFQGGIDGLRGKKIAIVGDVLHSRVARSNLYAQAYLGNEVVLIGPPTLLPDNFASEFPGQIKISRKLSDLTGCDAVMVLRLQLERQDQHFIPALADYSRQFCVTRKILDQYCPGAPVLHPGPQNRGWEIESALVDDERSLIAKQVAAGVAARMAILTYACLNKGAHETN